MAAVVSYSHVRFGELPLHGGLCRSKPTAKAPSALLDWPAHPGCTVAQPSGLSGLSSSRPMWQQPCSARLNSASYCVQGGQCLFSMTGFAAGVRAEEMSKMRPGTVILKSLAQLDQMFGETVLTKDICVISRIFAHLSRCWRHCLWHRAECKQLPHLEDNSLLCSLLFWPVCKLLAHAGLIAGRLSVM